MSTAGAVKDATLVVRSLKAIARGERVSFCYIADNVPLDMDLADQVPLERRRKMLFEQVGFECRCASCEYREQ